MLLTNLCAQSYVLNVYCSATLFYIVKGRDKSKFGTPLKNHIIRTLLNGMSTHLVDETMMRNGCLTLCQFAIPSDVVGVRKRWLKSSCRVFFILFMLSALRIWATGKDFITRRVLHWAGGICTTHRYLFAEFISMSGGREAEAFPWRFGSNFGKL